MPPEAFVSFAQNGEDIVLWRALRHIRTGVYVDVGAADPIDDSVTKAFYERGWRGVNVEPVPAYAELLRQDRPRDVTFAEAAGNGRYSEVTLYAVPGTGLSTLVEEEAERGQARGRDVVELSVPVRPLNDMLLEAGLKPGEIHFCKIDVEGAEADVLEGLDLAGWRPWVVVVESTRPNSTEQTHESWEPSLLSAGYEFCLFDGLNRFYVANEHAELRHKLSAPANVLDMPYIGFREQRQLEALQTGFEKSQHLLAEEAAHALVAEAATHDASSQLQQAEADLHWWQDRSKELGEDLLRWRERALKYGVTMAAAESQLADVRRELAATIGTVSWRVTSPLRVVRRALGQEAGPSDGWPAALRRRRAGDTPTVEPTAVANRSPVGELPIRRRLPNPEEVAWTKAALALGDRLDTVSALLEGSDGRPSGDLPRAMLAFEASLDASDLPSPTLAWLALVAVHATYPTEHDLDRASHVLELEGTSGFVRLLWDEAETSLRHDSASASGLQVVADTVVVDVTHTASHDLHTGVQRVVRETVGEWLATHELHLISWDYGRRVASALPPGEVARFRSWRDHVHGGDFVPRTPLAGDEPILVPWRSKVILPEIAGEWIRTDRYRALLRSGVSNGLSAIGYDLIPITIKETVIDGMAEVFADYLGILKYADAVSAISQSSAQEFSGWASTLVGQGLPGPVVAGHPLPTEPHPVTEDMLQAAHEELGLDASPMVLVVGSHEPRKNHMAILLAAERLWRQGMVFHLVFIGGSTWKSEGFTSWADLLSAAGRPLQVIRRASEEMLWAACHLARFTMFPSLAEGFGLPVMESLVSGTPAITSDHGSMAEMADGGGVVTVNPRDPEAITEAMHELLVDDEVLERLRKEAAAHVWKTWEEYSDETWAFLTGASRR